MPDSTRGDLEDLYVRSELTAQDSRALAQQSLDDPDLFERLTVLGAAKAALSNPAVSARLDQRSDSRTSLFMWSAAAAAMGAAILVFWLSPSLLRQHETSGAGLKPVLGLSSGAGQPILLAASGGQILKPSPKDVSFRDPVPAGSRSPRSAGSIVSIEDRLAEVDLGSVDGLTKGAELTVYLESGQPAGRLLVTTVFRDHARGRLSPGPGHDIRVKQAVRVANAVHLGALLEQVDSLEGRGDPQTARAAAEKALAWAESAGVPPAGTRIVLERLGALEFQAGALEPAEMHYQSAVASLHSPPAASPGEQANAWNALAVLRLLRGDYSGAEFPLSQAITTLPRTGMAFARSLNNRGVLAELTGDRSKAEASYTNALSALAGSRESSGEERRVVEANLARLKALR